MRFSCNERGRGVRAAALAALGALALSSGAFAQVHMPNESFDAVGFPPAGWTRQDLVITAPVNQFIRSTARTNSGAGAAFVDDLNTDVANDTWLITPAVDLSTAPAGTVLSYSENINFTDFTQQHDVLVSTTYDGVTFTGTIGAGMQWETLRSYVPPVPGTEDPAVEDLWVNYQHNVDAYAGGTAYFAFRYQGDFADEYFLDDVSVFTPVAFDVDAIQVDADTTIAENFTLFYTVTITNTGTTMDDFSVAAPTGAWTDGFFEGDQTTPFSSPFNLGPGASTTLEVMVTVPPMTDGMSDMEVVSVTGVGGSSDSVTITTTSFNPTGGYVFDNSNNDSGQPSFPTYSFIDISGTGTDEAGPLGDDNFVGPFALGFNFNFFGNVVTQYWIGSNGWITFTDPTGLSTATQRGNVAVGTAGGLENYVAGFWDDMDADDPDAGGTAIYHGPNGAAQEVITFNRLPRFSGDANGYVTFQIILNDSADGNIRIQYAEFGSSLNVVSFSAGIEDASGARGVQYHHNGVGGSLATPFAVEFSTNMANLPVEISGIELE